MFGFLDMMGNHAQRLVQNTEIDGGEIDTCRVTDSAKDYETGIKHNCYNNGKWVIVELYDTKEQALQGHNKWIGVMKTNPEYLFDVNQCEIGDLEELVFGNESVRKNGFKRINLINDPTKMIEDKTNER